ncbi:hypothetical protein ACP4OV_026880 [Aristida adscensionis]
MAAPELAAHPSVQLAASLCRRRTSARSRRRAPSGLLPPPLFTQALPRSRRRPHCRPGAFPQPPRRSKNPAAAAGRSREDQLQGGREPLRRGEMHDGESIARIDMVSF